MLFLCILIMIIVCIYYCYVCVQIGALSSSPSLSRSEPFSTFLRYLIVIHYCLVVPITVLLSLAVFPQNLTMKVGLRDMLGI